MTDGVLVYLDTNAFRDLVEGEPAISEPMQILFHALQRQPGRGITSELTLAEILAPSRSGRKRPPHLVRAYMNMLVWGRFLSLQPVSRTVLMETVRLRATSVTGRLKLPDAIHLATAILSGCQLFVSRDRGIPMPEAMRRVEIDDTAVRDVVEVIG